MPSQFWVKLAIQFTLGFVEYQEVRLKVPEVWFWKANQLQIFQFQAKQENYQELRPNPV